MKILYFSNFYLPEAIAPSFRASENAKHWNEMGDEVTIFTGYPNHPLGKIYPGYHVKLLKADYIEGVKVLRSKLLVKPNTSLLRRIMNGLSFLFFGIVNFLVHNKEIGKNYDVVLGTSPVIFTALLAWIYSLLHKLPFVFELRDLSYLQLQATGHTASSFGVKMMRSLEIFLCKRAKHVIVVTNGFRKKLVENGVEEKKIDIITNGVDIMDKTIQKETPYDLTLSYYGTLGISQDISETFVYAEEIKKYCKNFRYQIIGEGAQRKNLEVSLKSEEKRYVELLHGMPIEKLEEYYKQTNLSVVTLKNSESFRYTIPSKLFQIMGRGIAVLFIGPEGEASEIIEKYRAGITLTGNVEQDREKIKRFFKMPNWKEALYEMGENGHQAVKQEYSRRELAVKYEKILSSAAK